MERKPAKGVLGIQLVTMVGTLGGPAEDAVGQAVQERLEWNPQMASGAQVCRPKAQGMWAGTDSVYTGWKWQFRGRSRETERHYVS